MGEGDVSIRICRRKPFALSEHQDFLLPSAVNVKVRGVTLVEKLLASSKYSYTPVLLDYMQSGSISSKSTGMLSSCSAAHCRIFAIGWLVLRCCTDICGCLHSWHLLRRRWCMQIPLPLQSLHWFRTRKCWQRPTPPHCLHLSRRFHAYRVCACSTQHGSC